MMPAALQYRRDVRRMKPINIFAMVHRANHGIFIITARERELNEDGVNVVPRV